MISAKPFIKWVGGKAQLLPELLRLTPLRFDRYIEPFVGGGAVFFAIKPPQGAILNDSNKALINTYRQVQRRLDDLLDELQRISKSYARYDSKGRSEYYSVVRDAFNLPQRDLTLAAARFIFLNKTSFNGLYRVNRKGEFNVPWGKRETFEVDVDNLRACSKTLQGVTLFHADFAEVLREAKRDDLVYCDPPYVPVSSTSSFTSYTRGGFTLEDQRRLCEEALAAKKRGAFVVLSNSDCPTVRALYSKGWKFHEVKARRNINSKGGSRGAVGELLIT